MKSIRSYANNSKKSFYYKTGVLNIIIAIYLHFHTNSSPDIYRWGDFVRLVNFIFGDSVRLVRTLGGILSAYAKT